MSDKTTNYFIDSDDSEIELLLKKAAEIKDLDKTTVHGPSDNKSIEINKPEISTSISFSAKESCDKKEFSFKLPKELIVDMRLFCVINKLSVSSFITILSQDKSISSNLITTDNLISFNKEQRRVRVIVDSKTRFFFKSRSIESFTTISKVVGQYVYTYLKLNNYDK